MMDRLPGGMAGLSQVGIEFPKPLVSGTNLGPSYDSFLVWKRQQQVQQQEQEFLYWKKGSNGDNNKANKDQLYYRDGTPYQSPTDQNAGWGGGGLA